MYPVIIRRLCDLRVGDKLITHSGLRYPQPLQVIAALGSIPGTPGRGVRVTNPTGEGPSEWVIYPWQADGQVFEIDRPAPNPAPPNAGIHHNRTNSGDSAVGDASC